MYCTLALCRVQTFSMVDEHIGDKRVNVIFFDNENECLLTGSNLLEKWPLTRAARDVLQTPKSHEQSIALALYNDVFAQVPYPHSVY